MADITAVRALADRITANVEKVVYGKGDKVRLLLCALLCGGHVLMDDIPGTGKTSLARALARSVDCGSKRVQFTPDLLPSDLTGINFYQQKTGEFVFRPGPIFTNIVIADEINRTTPRTQSALLECMEERQTTVDGVTYPMEEPFLVIATQNPVESQGTFPLPEAQIDRFFMKLSLGYPDNASEKLMIGNYMEESPLASLTPVCQKSEILEASRAVKKVTVSGAVRDYLVALSDATRHNDAIRLGVSPRGTLALTRASQAWAALSGRDYVLPDDVKAVALPVLSHRIISRSQNTVRLVSSNETILQSILDTVPAPI
ncbi:MAG: AAA family ATPase [Lachnospiraceae bacterium]|nr:AAA family ATPase [Lachnospiraceae bacterium]